MYITHEWEKDSGEKGGSDSRPMNSVKCPLTNDFLNDGSVNVGKEKDEIPVPEASNDNMFIQDNTLYGQM
jgi:hypothetical protein